MLIKKAVIESSEWPPSPPDCNPLDFYFWNAISTKMYEGRRDPFASIDELKTRIKRVWNGVDGDMLTFRKAIDEFRKRLQSVVDCEGESIKMYFS